MQRAFATLDASPLAHASPHCSVPPAVPAQILVLAIFFQKAPVDAGLQVMGLVCAIFGLMAFLEGLRVCIMVCGSSWWQKDSLARQHDMWPLAPTHRFDASISRRRPALLLTLTHKDPPCLLFPCSRLPSCSALNCQQRCT